VERTARDKESNIEIKFIIEYSHFIVWKESNIEMNLSLNAVI
jgi:hypothetical protein